MRKGIEKYREEERVSKEGKVMKGGREGGKKMEAGSDVRKKRWMHVQG